MDRLLRGRAAYGVVWLACFAPIVWLAWRVFAGELGANPIETLIRQLGVWGLRLLIVGLAITPAARIFRMPVLIRFRRTVGVFAFSYLLLHLLNYVVTDQWFDWAAIGKDILKRPFITVGMIAFVLLVPLAATSTNRALRKLGPGRWRQLHRLTYLIVPLGVLHYYMLVKADHRPPLIYAGIVAALLGWRLWEAARKRRALTGTAPAP
ncbi:MAG TPA: protein-methionine-sulfoxide reductase heme-binding subunit MsrQ [Caulobacter sp.]|nr:protein-methionine-sulfoxide reductase heme-binding subunit MsrQ [Caulobacter sp.]